MKVASRFLLPVEMLAGLYTFFWGLSGLGAFGDCTLYYALLSLDHNHEWGLTLGGLGGVMAGVAVFEWFVGRQVSIKVIYWLVSVRATLSFFMIGAWIAAAAVVYIAPKLMTIAALFPAALLHVGVSIYLYRENLKVKYALDDTVPTSTLQFHR